MRTAVAAGLALGALSRVEELTNGFSAGISSDSCWVATAFVVGALAGGAPRAAAAGALALTIANLSYYAWSKLHDPAVAFADVAGPVLPWFAFGLAGGCVFGVAGHVWRTTPSAPLRLAAALLLAGVMTTEALEPADLRPGDLVGALIGVGLVLVSVRERVVAIGAAAALVVVGLSGALAPLLP